MGWNDKCLQGGPAGFTDEKAQQLVAAADFSQSVFVNVSAQEGQTKQAYTYVQHTDTANVNWRLCVVGHTHLNQETGLYSNQGNTFIPGWSGDANAGWAMPTPQDKMIQISMLPNSQGAFPGNDRYPQNLG
ncbi:MAG: hypothetical protein IPK14_13100 [Blastocatellia bacterium]|nr:hypothetical protein [Blastocatellia bacterium]MBL8196758.1 hypothetical protein [Blastocatellia bacterium]MBN8725934.1 hypothetical protein [Acidobacteriota bacterium]